MAIQTTEEFKSAGSTSYTTAIEKIKDTDLKVRIGGALQTYVASNPSTGEYTVTNNPTTIVLPAAASAEVHIYRETDVDTAAAVFVPGSSIKAADLNAMHDMARMGLSEARNKVITADIKDGQVTSAKIEDGTIVNADINASAAISGSKISSNFGSQTVETTGNISAGGTLAVTGTSTLSGNLGVTGTSTFTGAIDANGGASIDNVQIGVTDNNEIDTSSGNLTIDSAGGTTTIDDTLTVSGNATLQGTLGVTGTTTTADITGGAVVTSGTSTSDTKIYSAKRAGEIFYGKDTVEEIQSGETWSAADDKVATTAAIDARIIDLVDDVGGFVAIANETSFPTANPDVNNGAGTIVSVKAASTTLTPSGTTVTIANGAGTGNTVTVTGVPSAIGSGFGFLVETTTTLHTYTFHRLSPKATEVTTLAGKATELGLLGTTAVVEDMSILGTADVVADMAILGTTDVVSDLNTLGTADVVADLNILGTTDVVADMNILGTSANVTAMSNCSGSISSINNASSNLSSINNYGDQYQVASSNPSTDGGGNDLAEGDLYFNTTANELKVYDGSAWVSGVTQTGNFALTTGNSFSGDNTYVDNAKARFGTGQDLEIFHDGTHSRIKDTGTGNLFIHGTNTQFLNAAGSETIAKFTENGPVELYHDNVKTIETTATGANLTGNLDVSSGIDVTGDITVSGNVDGRDVATDGTKLDGIATSANNYSHPNHTGEVTSSGDGAMTIADDVVDEANLKVSNSPTNGYFLSAQSGNTGGLTWAAIDSDSITEGNSKAEVIGSGTDNGEFKVGLQDATHSGTNKTALRVYQPSDGLNKLELFEENTASNAKLSIKHVYSGNGTSEINFTTNDAGSYADIEYWGSTNTFKHMIAGTERFTLDASNAIFNTDLLPKTDSTYDLGSNSWRWQNVYADTLYGDGSNLTNLPSQTDQNFTNADHTKLDGIEADATADQTASEITTLLGDQNLYTTGNIGRDAGDYISFTTDTQMDVYVNGNNEFRFEADGDFHADGDVIAQSTTTASDRKLKENIEVIPNALDKVQALNGVSFDWKKTGEKSAGVIAQEVQAVLPEAVKEVTPVGGGDSHLTVNYHALTSILIESIKELKAEIEELKGGK